MQKVLATNFISIVGILLGRKKREKGTFKALSIQYKKINAALDINAGKEASHCVGYSKKEILKTHLIHL